QDADKILEAAREAVRTAVVLRVGVAELAGGGDERMFAGLDVDARVDPGLFAGQLDFLRKTLFSQRRLRGSGVLRILFGSNLRQRGRGVLTDELRVRGMWKGCRHHRESNEKSPYSHERSNHAAAIPRGLKKHLHC